MLLSPASKPCTALPAIEKPHRGITHCSDERFEDWLLKSSAALWEAVYVVEPTWWHQSGSPSPTARGLQTSRVRSTNPATGNGVSRLTGVMAVAVQGTTRRMSSVKRHSGSAFGVRGSLRLTPCKGFVWPVE